MIQILERIRAAAAEHWAKLSEDAAERRHRQQALDKAIEHVVDKANPRLRALPGYRRKLGDGVARALEYCDSIAARIPGPVLLDRETWAADPLVNALFGNHDALRRAISSPEVRRFVRETPLDDGDCYGVLLAMPLVRNQLGVELSGDSIQRDVRQTTVSFSDHELVLPAADPESVRAAAARGVMDILVGVVMTDIAGQEARIAELDESLRRARIQQKALGHATASKLDLLGNGSTDARAEHASLARLIQDLDRDLTAARKGLSTLDDYLIRLDGLLRHPETEISAETVKVRLDRMNIVRDDIASDELSFLRGYRRDRPGRILLLVRFPRSELIPDSDRIAELERYFGT